MADLVRAPAAAQQKGHNEFGELPEWNLDDLYPGPESKELKSDLEWSKNEAKAFEADYKGKLEALAKAGRLFEAVARSLRDVLTQRWLLSATRSTRRIRPV